MGMKIYHMIGDSILDTLRWGLMADGSNLEAAQRGSVEGQLRETLNNDDRYRVYNHAYDGFTTGSVLEGGKVGQVLRLHGEAVLGSYFKGRGVTAYADVQPLKQLEGSISDSRLPPGATHYVIISVGGNDFRERLRRIDSPIAILREIPHIQERYLQILDRVQQIGKNTHKEIKPILMLQYRPDAHNDCYGVYTVLKIVGVVAMALHLLSIGALAHSLAKIVARKVSLYQGLFRILGSGGAFALACRILPLKVTKGVLWNRQEVAMTTIGVLLEKFYQPILARAKKDNLSIIDLSNTFNPYDSSLYTSGIEPSEAGGAKIAKEIIDITHIPTGLGKGKMLSAGGLSDTPGPDGWEIRYPQRPKS